MQNLTSKVLLLLVLAATARLPSAEGADKWLSVRSKNFLLVGNASESQIRRVARNLEQFREGIAVLFPSVKNQSTVDSTVIVFKDDASFKPFKPLYEGKPSNVSGYFQGGSDVNLIALTGDVQTPHVILHEFIHSLTKDTTRPLPPWASEGLAEFYSTFEVNGDGKELLLGRPISDHVQLLRDRPLIPIATLFGVEHDSPYYNERTKQGMFYAQSWGVVHYLMAGNSGKRRMQFSQYVSLIADGKSVDDSFQEAFQIDYAAFERELGDYLRNRITFPAYRLKPNEKLDIDRETRTTPLSEAQAAYYLGDLLLHLNRLDVAEQQLQKAITLDPKFGASFASMGMLRIRQSKREEALDFLSRAVEMDTQNHMAHYYYASLLQRLAADEASEDRMARMKVMRIHLNKSIEIAPHFVEAYSLLGYVALVLEEDLADAEQKMGKAIAIAPGREEMRLTLAQIMMRNNKALAARALLTSLRATTGDTAMRDRADRLLENIALRQESEQAMREYEERRKAEGPATLRSVPNRVVADDGPPKITRTDTFPPAPQTTVDTSVLTPKRKIQGPQVEGFLTMVDCTRGLTLQVRVGNGNVQLHSDKPSTVEFISYVANVSGGIQCGPVKPEVKVVITYRRSSDPSFLGEPLLVEFPDK